MEHEDKTRDLLREGAELMTAHVGLMPDGKVDLSVAFGHEYEISPMFTTWPEVNRLLRETAMEGLSRFAAHRLAPEDLEDHDYGEHDEPSERDRWTDAKSDEIAVEYRSVIERLVPRFVVVGISAPGKITE